VWGGILAVCLLLTANVASAQPYGQAPGNLLDQYRALRPAWFAAVTTAANRLFGALALVEFAWTAAVLLMERTDLQGWTAGLIKRMMFIGAFYALLVNGPVWIPAIVDSFQIIGRNAAGLAAGLSPGDVFLRGLDITNSLCSTASATGFFSNPAGAFALVLAGLIIFLAFVVVSVHFIMAMVESYVVVGAGFLFLGFGGSRWTAPYVERYIALAVAVGVKIMVLYLLIGGGMSLSNGWAARAAAMSTTANPLLEALDIVGGSIVFMALCWQAPKFTASLLGGSPAFSGGDVAAVGFAGAQTAFVVGTVGAGAAKLLAARAATSGVMSVAQAAGIGSGAGPGGGSGAGPSTPRGGPASDGGPKTGGAGPSRSPGGGPGTSSASLGNNGGGQPVPPAAGAGGAGGETGTRATATQTPPGPSANGASSAPKESPRPSGTASTGDAQTSNASAASTTPLSAPAAQLGSHPSTQVSPPQYGRSAGFAESLEGAFGRGARLTSDLRRVLPPEGHHGTPANLNLNTGDE
jgi:type IV secretion system protein TrbL